MCDDDGDDDDDDDNNNDEVLVVNQFFDREKDGYAINPNQCASLTLNVYECIS